ncbi:FliM/FliN family flagellar motor C-terminal domain-containing protein [Variovorax beijingensis]|uniref:FliM/FliN family flagellar motor C-terminal domain-containing protein n=1 Tax=Variovorax beijingensis TaxID=2496117 RepID=UPI00164534AD|nr:FliM/FliN family flagellar motor C-terminal domain-containing protein [Variovorax beijingensis]
MSSRSAAASALLDPAESMLKARPLRSWKAAQKEALRTLFVALHRDWSAEWSPVREAASVQADVEVTEPDGTLVLAADGRACWSFAEAPRHAGAIRARGPDALSRSSARDASQAALQALADHMFAFDLAASGTAPVAPVIAPAVVRAAWADWLQRLGVLLAGFALEPQQSRVAHGTNAPSDRWSGVLCVRWTWCGGVWSLGLPHAVVAALLSNQPPTKSAPTALAPMLPKARLDQALAEERVALRVMLDGVELNLGQLQELRLDDVVPLEHLLDSPALVIGTDGTPVCHGWLGQSDGRIAVELAVPVALNPNTHPSKEKTP